MYFITTKRMLEVCFSAHPNIQYRTVFNKSRGCYSKFCNVLNKKGYGLFTLRVVILNHEINKHRREWLCIY